MFEPNKEYDCWTETGVKRGATVNVFASLNVDEVSTGLDQTNATRNLAPESQLYPFT